MLYASLLVIPGRSVGLAAEWSGHLSCLTPC